MRADDYRYSGLTFGYYVNVVEKFVQKHGPIPIEQIPQKKKTAIGVRGMKLGAKDCVEEVYYTQNAVENAIEYHGKSLLLNGIKLGSRDSKGTKIR